MKAMRAHSARKIALQLRRQRAATRIQAVVRGWLVRRAYAHTRHLIIRCVFLSAHPSASPPLPLALPPIPPAFPPSPPAPPTRLPSISEQFLVGSRIQVSKLRAPSPRAP